jgi:hypothetical protein
MKQVCPIFAILSLFSIVVANGCTKTSTPIPPFRGPHHIMIEAWSRVRNPDRCFGVGQNLLFLTRARYSLRTRMQWIRDINALFAIS